MEEICARLSYLKRGHVPLGHHVLTAGIDIGQTHIHWAVGAYGNNFSGSIIDFGVRNFLPGESEEATIHRELTALISELMRRDFPVEGEETPLRIAAAAVDSGYQTKLIYQVCRRCDWPETVIPSRGMGGDRVMRPPKNTPRRDIGPGWYYAKTADGDARLFHIDVDHWKCFTDSRLRTPIGAPGALSFFGKSGRELWDIAGHFRAERREKKTRMADGVEYVKWRADPSMPNHWFDCVVYSHALAHRLGVRLAEQEAAPERKKRAMKTWFN
jgi:phage terminase large subunit GpA-like protein